jgi:DNA-binding NarL/FixJ family response regulator
VTGSLPTVLIADDHRMLADAFERILAENYEVVGKVADGRELLEAAPELRPDVIVLDISMPRLNGIDAARRLRELLPDAALVAVTMHSDPQVAAEARRAGILGFVTKSAAASELKAAVEAALAGRSYLTPQMPADQVEAAFRLVSKRDGSRLTPRQREVLQLLAEGLAMKQVASALGLSVRTVAHHKYKIMEEQTIDSNAGLVQLAIEERLIANPGGTGFPT